MNFGKRRSAKANAYRKRNYCFWILSNSDQYSLYELSRRDINDRIQYAGKDSNTVSGRCCHRILHQSNTWIVGGGDEKVIQNQPFRKSLRLQTGL